MPIDELHTTPSVCVCVCVCVCGGGAPAGKVVEGSRQGLVKMGQNCDFQYLRRHHNYEGALINIQNKSRNQISRIIW